MERNSMSEHSKICLKVLADENVRRDLLLLRPSTTRPTSQWWTLWPLPRASRLELMEQAHLDTSTPKSTRNQGNLLAPSLTIILVKFSAPKSLIKALILC